MNNENRVLFLLYEEEPGDFIDFGLVFFSGDGTYINPYKKKRLAFTSEFVEKARVSKKFKNLLSDLDSISDNDDVIKEEELKELLNEDNQMACLGKSQVVGFKYIKDDYSLFENIVKNNNMIEMKEGIT